ncbi:hypothetical protein AVEN_60214-1 [Araneus ventricosus]|uniref:Uncharacterized protein n=1 Tax=Araneus ventricosus TaxID=182803 RepID=A0A4Y2CNW8_ARAVE|nr:hypothetical protein AVEN_60214-1 [Araneus ventricosus]
MYAFARVQDACGHAPSGQEASSYLLFTHPDCATLREQSLTFAGMRSLHYTDSGRERIRNRVIVPHFLTLAVDQMYSKLNAEGPEEITYVCGPPLAFRHSPVKKTLSNRIHDRSTFADVELHSSCIFSHHTKRMLSASLDIHYDPVLSQKQLQAELSYPALSYLTFLSSEAHRLRNFRKNPGYQDLAWGQPYLTHLHDSFTIFFFFCALGVPLSCTLQCPSHLPAMSDNSTATLQICRFAFAVSVFLVLYPI